MYQVPDPWWKLNPNDEEEPGGGEGEVFAVYDPD